MRNSLSLLKTKGFEPKVILDVGAYRGQWSEIARELWPTSSLFMVEPLPELVTDLVKTSKLLGACFIPCLLSDKEGKEHTFFLGATGSSIHKPKRFDADKQINIRARTMDSLCSAELGAFPDLIKIDVQGAEEAVLDGGVGAISAATVVILELSIVNSYDKGLLVGEMVELMSSLGFSLYDIAGTNRANKSRSVNEFDGIFVRRGHSLWDIQSFLP